MQHYFGRSYVQIPLLAMVVAAVYYHTLDVPFYLDDFSSIQENPTIYQWQGTLAELWQFSAMRIVGYLSFALNYQVHQFQVQGYHLVNILIHFLTGCAVLALVRGLLRTPALSGTDDNVKLWLPLIAALIFVLHPLQIQGVTYIVQRLASLAALFYIAAMACFIQAQLARRWLIIGIWSMACLGFMGLAFFTKQNTATLPLALLLLVVVFFPRDWRRLGAVAGSAVGLLFAGWIGVAFILGANPFSLEAMYTITQETTTISRSSYLATQFSVLWTYIQLFFIPTGLHIDYQYPITERLLERQAIIALTGHAFVLYIAVVALRYWPIVGFGILFYYLAHAVESSLIPIRDVAFEHRTYLPNLGLVLLCSWLLVASVPQALRQYADDYWSKGLRYLPAVLIISVLLSLSIATWQRNQLWRDPVALWQDNVDKAPEKKRAWIILGKHWIQAGEPEKGLDALRKTIDITVGKDGRRSMTMTTETMLNMVVAYKMLKQYDKALNLTNQALQSPLSPFDRAKFLVNQGNVMYEQRQFAQAEQSYRAAVATYPQSLSARANLASILGATGRFAEAEQIYLQILQIDPNNPLVRENLAKVQKLAAQQK